jgi:hypothetical protein
MGEGIEGAKSCCRCVLQQILKKFNSIRADLSAENLRQEIRLGGTLLNGCGLI